MHPHLVYYQLGILAIGDPRPAVVVRHAPRLLAEFSRCNYPASNPAHQAQALAVYRAQSGREPTAKAPCALCKRETGETPPAPRRRPDPMPLTNRHLREVDTSMHFCPHTNCHHRGWLGQNNLRANGHPGGGPWRQFHCTSCEGYFPEPHGTIFHGKQAAVELIVRVLAYLAEGLGIRATAQVFEVTPNTVLAWLGEAAEHLRAFSAYFLCDMHVEQLQLDELYAVRRALKAGEVSEDEAIDRLERSSCWVWTAMEPKSMLLLVVDVDTHTLAMAAGLTDHVWSLREVLMFRVPPWPQMQTV